MNNPNDLEALSIIIYQTLLSYKTAIKSRKYNDHCRSLNLHSKLFTFYQSYEALRTQLTLNNTLLNDPLPPHIIETAQLIASTPELTSLFNNEMILYNLTNNYTAPITADLTFLSLYEDQLPVYETPTLIIDDCEECDGQQTIPLNIIIQDPPNPNELTFPVTYP